MAEEEGPGVFDKRWQPLIRNFISKCPPGHLADVCNGCRELTQAEIPSDLLEACCAEHNEKLALALELPTESPSVGIACESSRVAVGGARRYRDVYTGQYFSVDQELQEVTEMMEPKERTDLSAEMANIGTESAKPFKEALQRQLDRYVAERFPQPVAGTLPTCKGSSGVLVTAISKDDSVEIRVTLASRRARPRGYWAGNWASRWRTVFQPGQEKPADLAGLLEFRTHYAENCNVHFQRKSVGKTAIKETADAEKWAAKVCEAIMRLEDEFHCATDEYCANMGSGALKSMRRVLPLTRERFDWRPIPHALVRDMKNAESKGER